MPFIKKVCNFLSRCFDSHDLSKSNNIIVQQKNKNNQKNNSKEKVLKKEVLEKKNQLRRRNKSDLKLIKQQLTKYQNNQSQNTVDVLTENCIRSRQIVPHYQSRNGQNYKNNKSSIKQISNKKQSQRIIFEVVQQDAWINLKKIKSKFIKNTICIDKRCILQLEQVKDKDSVSIQDDIQKIKSIYPLKKQVKRKVRIE